jgi:putative component of membrane protein insertase Oxa1/YidC/SpoIIIJ protein YidD
MTPRTVLKKRVASEMTVFFLMSFRRNTPDRAQRCRWTQPCSGGAIAAIHQFSKFTKCVLIVGAVGR